MQILSFILSLLGLTSMIIASLIKGENMKKILFFVFCGNKIGGYLGFAINITVFLMILSFFFLIHYIKQGITKNKITEKQPLAE